MKHALRMLGAVALAACSRHEDTTLTLAIVDAGVQTNTLGQMAEQWNRAVSQRDPSLVSAVYGSRVTFHGVPLRHDQIVAVRSAAFDDDQSFTQEISGVHVTGRRVDLDKTWVRFSKVFKSHAWLEGSLENNRWVVTAEGDDASDSRAKMAPQKNAPSCDDLAKQVALSTVQGKALVQGPPDHLDVRIAGTPPSFPAYSVALVGTANGQPTTVAWYDVVPCRIYAPAPSPVPAPGACLTPGNVPGAITDVFRTTVLTPDTNLLVAMSACPWRGR